ncbi:MAG TPA: hypothetical protein VH593_27645 [Ktedonobacteraceae bacterium]|jgi:hypothetical protein
MSFSFAASLVYSRAEPKGSNPRFQATSGVIEAQALQKGQQSKVIESAIICDQYTGPGGIWAKASWRRKQRA